MFGHILKRDKKQLIDKLRQKFDDRKGLYFERDALCYDGVCLAYQYISESRKFHSSFPMLVTNYQLPMLSKSRSFICRYCKFTSVLF